jgi:hypothetical protein
MGAYSKHRRWFSVGMGTLVVSILLILTLFGSFWAGRIALSYKELALVMFVASKLTAVICLLLVGGYAAIRPFVLARPVETGKGRIKSKWTLLAVVFLATNLCGHFIWGTQLWLFAFSVWGMSMWIDLLYGGWPCFGLLALSLVAFAFAVRARRMAIPFVALVVVLSAWAFWFDMTHDHWQLAWFGTRESGGGGKLYLTWWWR